MLSPVLSLAILEKDILACDAEGPCGQEHALSQYLADLRTLVELANQSRVHSMDGVLAVGALQRRLLVRAAVPLT